MKSKSNSFLRVARNPRGLTRFLAFSLGLASLPVHADTEWTGTNSQDWSDAGNWNNGVPVENGNQGAAVINIATGNFPQITAAGTYQADFDIKIGAGVSGRLDQSAGTLATGEGNWFLLGYLGVQATYNLTGSGSLKIGGLSTQAGNFLIGLDGGTLSTWNVNTTGTVEAGGIFAGNAGASTGTINVDAGTVNVSGDMQIGGNFFGQGGTGQLNMTGGNVTANVISFARGSNNTAAISGTASITGGTLSSKQWFTLGFAGSSSNVATVTNSGGTINVNTSGGGNMEMGVFDPTTNLFTLNSGSVNLQNSASIIYGSGGNHTGPSTFTQNNGTVSFYSDAGSTIGGTGSVNLGNGGSTGTYNYNLNGGTLTVPQISKANPAATGNFNFNGGTLKPTGSSTTFLQGLTAANVQAGGAFIDSNGFDVTIGQALLDSGGGLTKSGSGTLTLSGASTYTGATSVNAGKLDLTGFLASNTVTVAGNATLALNGDLGGALAVNSSGHLALGVAADSGSQVTRTIIGALTLTAGNIVDLTAAATPAGGTYVLATATGGITGTLTTVNYNGITGNLSITGNNLELTVSATAYSTWADSKGLTGANNGPTQDPESDDIENVLEFVLGGNPLASDTSILPDLSDDGTYFVFTFDRADASLGDVTLSFEYGTNLTGWTSIAIPASATGIPVNITDNGATDQVVVKVLKAGNTKLFGRLRAVK